MSKSVNKWIGVGHLGSDPEIRYTGKGTAVVNCSLATTETWTGTDGNKQEETTWHRLVIWAKLGEIVAQYCGKGSRIYVEGSIKHRDYEDGAGVKKHVRELNVKEVVMLDPKGESRSTGHTGRPSPTPLPTTGGNTGGFDDADLPFNKVDGRYV